MLRFTILYAVLALSAVLAAPAADTTTHPAKSVTKSVLKSITKPTVSLTKPPKTTALPKTCTIGFKDDREHGFPIPITKKCYTYTKTAPKPHCPTHTCVRPTDIVCPLYIRVTEITVPCATNCCPSTPTTYVAAKTCTSCPKGCVIPTETSTVTTGCPRKPTVSGLDERDAVSRLI